MSLSVYGAALRARQAAASFRANRQRLKRFTYGDQWSDTIRDTDGRFTTERDSALRRGRRPMTNNLIRRLVKCIIGRFRLSLDDERLARDPALARLYALNRLDELDSRLLEEFLISGCAVQRVVCERRPEGADIWVDNVSPDRFFVNTFADPRGRDIELVGMTHSMSFTEIALRFGHNDPDRIARLRRAFVEGSPADDLAVERSGPIVRYPVMEVWTLEAAQRLRCLDRSTGCYREIDASELPAVEAENARRAAAGIPAIDCRHVLSTLWHCRWFGPEGFLVDDCLSPFANGSHPFIVKLYPLIDGEVHSLVEDVIEQQININRLMTTIDYVMGISAKGALLFPEGQKSEAFEWDDIGRLWASPDGILRYKGDRTLPEPRQVVTQGADRSARDLLALQMEMFEEVSGVNRALMGRATSAVGGARLYESEVENASVAIRDILETFHDFRRARDRVLASAPARQ